MPSIEQNIKIKRVGMIFPYPGVAREIMTPIQIGLPYDPELKPGQPEPGDFIALWDTGATKSNIKHGLAKKFNLPFIREIPVRSVSESFISAAFWAVF